MLFLTILVKWIASSKKSIGWEKIALFMIILSIISTLYQGNKGGTLVYKYSTAIDNKIIKNRIKEAK